MSAQHCSLARLPLELYEELAWHYFDASGSTTGSHAGDDDNADGVVDVSTKHTGSLPKSSLSSLAAGASLPNTTTTAVPAHVLRQLLTQRLQAVPIRWITGTRRRRWNSTTFATASSSSFSSTPRSTAGTSTTSSTSSTTTLRITTVGEFLRLPIVTILRTVDPLLTYSECIEWRRRILKYCTAASAGSKQYHRLSPTMLPSRTVWEMLLPSHEYGSIIPSHTADTGITTTTATTPPTSTTATTTTMTKRTDKPLGIIPSSYYLSTGIQGLDEQLLGGGIRVGTLTELVGPAGVGKTQFALQMALRLTMGDDQHGRQSGQEATVYIDTEQKLSLLRFRDMTHARYRQECQKGQLQADETTGHTIATTTTITTTSHNIVSANPKRQWHPNDALGNLLVHAPGTMEELLHILWHSLEQDILQRRIEGKPPIRLVVIDTITSPIQRQGERSAALQAATILSCAQFLKRMAEQFHLAILVLNQSVGGSCGGDGGAGGDHVPEGTIASTSVRAALGTAWHHCVTTRLYMDGITTGSNHHHNNNPNVTTTSLSLGTTALHDLSNRDHILASTPMSSSSSSSSFLNQQSCHRNTTRQDETLEIVNPTASIGTSIIGVSHTNNPSSSTTSTPVSSSPPPPQRTITIVKSNCVRGDDLSDS